MIYIEESFSTHFREQRDMFDQREKERLLPYHGGVRRRLLCLMAAFQEQRQSRKVW